MLVLMIPDLNKHTAGEDIAARVGIVDRGGSADRGGTADRGGHSR